MCNVWLFRCSTTSLFSLSSASVGTLCATIQSIKRMKFYLRFCNQTNSLFVPWWYNEHGWKNDCAGNSHSGVYIHCDGSCLATVGSVWPWASLDTVELHEATIWKEIGEVRCGHVESRILVRYAVYLCIYQTSAVAAVALVSVVCQCGRMNGFRWAGTSHIHQKYNIWCSVLSDLYAPKVPIEINHLCTVRLCLWFVFG